MMDMVALPKRFQVRADPDFLGRFAVILMVHGSV